MVILSQAAAIARRILTELVRGRRSLVFWAVFPALMLVLFGTIHAGGRHTGVSFDRTAPGILIGAALFFSCLGGTVSLLAAERERRTLRRLFLSPLAPAAYLMGVTLAFLTVGAGQGLLVYGVSLAFGGRFHGSGLLGALIVGLTVCAYVGLGAFFGARFAGRTEDVNGRRPSACPCWYWAARSSPPPCFRPACFCWRSSTPCFT